jgi:hypothetical protein
MNAMFSQGEIVCPKFYRGRRTEKFLCFWKGWLVFQRPPHSGAGLSLVWTVSCRLPASLRSREGVLRLGEIGLDP